MRIGDPRRGAGIIVPLATDPVFAETTGGYFSVSGAERRGRNQPNRRRKGRRRLRAVRSVVPESMWAAILEELEQLEQHSQVLDIGTD
jgi:hypothetical protein